MHDGLCYVTALAFALGLFAEGELSTTLPHWAVPGVIAGHASSGRQHGCKHPALTEPQAGSRWVSQQAR